MDQVPNQAIAIPEPGPDRLTKTKSIYDAGAGEIFWRNFLAGFSRSLGMIFVYFLFLVASGYVFLQLAGPMLGPLLNNLSSITSLNKSLDAIQGIKPSSNPTFPEGLPALNFSK